MKNGYLAMYGEEKGGYSSKNRGVFLNEDDAKIAVKGYGFWGGDGNVVPIKIYESLEEYEEESLKG